MLEKYSAHRKRILSIFNQLHAVGCVVSSCVCVFSDVCHTSAQSDLELPRVVVIGNQSAGKWHSALNNASWDSYCKASRVLLKPFLGYATKVVMCFFEPT